MEQNREMDISIMFLLRRELLRLTPVQVILSILSSLVVPVVDTKLLAVVEEEVYLMALWA
jgi:hypothetical protein